VTLQQLLDRLHCFPIQPAVLPALLSEQPESQEEEEGEETEPPPEAESEPAEDMETAELMRTLAAKLTPFARYRWRRSRWLRHCPVALADGKVVPGKMEFAVSYGVMSVLYFVSLVSLYGFAYT